MGGQIAFIDQDKGAPKVHQYSVDIQRELPGNMAVTVGYIGATGRDIGFGGTEEATFLNINQIDPDVARRVFPGANGGWDAEALRESVPNPFFGVEGAGELGARPTVQQGQLLRPFPAFGDIRMYERTEGGRRQYHAATFVLDKRTGATAGWASWGGRMSYTWSSMKDNQLARATSISSSRAIPQDTEERLRPRCRERRGNYDSPHRNDLAPIVSSAGARAPVGRQGVAARRLERLGDRRTGQRLAAEPAMS